VDISRTPVVLAGIATQTESTSIGYK
jgi:hypothetical protein